jgi:hypothetical protein
MELKEPLSNKYFTAKNRFSSLQRYLKVKSFFRNPWMWAIAIFTGTAIALQIYFLQTYLSTLPERIPLLTMYLSLEDRLFPRNYLIALPAICVILIFIACVAATKTYYINKLLAIFTMLLALIGSSFITYSLIKIIAAYYV